MKPRQKPGSWIIRTPPKYDEHGMCLPVPLWSEIMQVTLRNHSGEIAKSIAGHNKLFRALSRRP